MATDNNDTLVPLSFGAHYGTSWISKAIQWQQRTDVSHISIIDNDGTLIEAREGHGVIQTRRLEQVRQNERVDVLTVMVRPECRTKAIQWAKSQLGKPYDYISILRFITRRQAERANNGRWFCSEFAFVAAQKAGIALLKRIDPCNVSPGHFILSPCLRWESTNTP